MEGSARVLYNHYRTVFPTVDGVLSAAVIDEKYCFSYVFRGNFQLHLKTAMLGVEPTPVLERHTQGGLDFRDLEFVLSDDSAAAAAAAAADTGPVPEFKIEVVSDPDAEAESASRAPRRPVALITQKQADEMTYGRPGAGAGAGSGAGPPGSRAVAELTEELKSLSADELRAQSDRYKTLVESRDLEDILFSRG